MLKGYKTYICVVLGVIVVIAGALGYIDAQVEQMLLGLVGFGSIAAVRSAINNSVPSQL